MLDDLDIIDPAIGYARPHLIQRPCYRNLDRLGEPLTLFLLDESNMTGDPIATVLLNGRSVELEIDRNHASSPGWHLSLVRLGVGDLSHLPDLPAELDVELSWPGSSARPLGLKVPVEARLARLVAPQITLGASRDPVKLPFMTSTDQLVDSVTLSYASNVASEAAGKVEAALSVHAKANGDEISVEIVLPDGRRVSRLAGPLTEVTLTFAESDSKRLDIGVPRACLMAGTPLDVEVTASLVLTFAGKVCGETEATARFTIEPEEAAQTLNLSLRPLSGKPISKTFELIDPTDRTTVPMEVDITVRPDDPGDAFVELFEFDWGKWTTGTGGDETVKLVCTGEDDAYFNRPEAKGLGDGGEPPREVSLESGRGERILIGKTSQLEAQRLELRWYPSDKAYVVLAKIRVNRIEGTTPVPGRYFCFDFGNSSMCGAYLPNEAGANPVLVNLGKLLSKVDRSHRERSNKRDGNQTVISSYIGLHEPKPTESARPPWRENVAPESYWGLPDAELRPALSVPFAPEYHIRREIAQESAWITNTLKMQLLANHTNVSWIAGERHHPPEDKVPTVAEMTGHVFGEIAEFHLNWDRVIEHVYGGVMILTHPHQFSHTSRENFKRAAAPMFEVLGIEKSNVRLVPEGRAALEGALWRNHGELSEIARENGHAPIIVLSFDLGGGTLDLTLAEFTFDRDGSPPKIREIGSLGASAGGDAIDLVLYFLAHDKLMRLSQAGDIVYPTKLVSESAYPAPSNNERQYRAGIVNAIKEAKRRLCDRSPNDQPIGWDPGTFLEIEVGVDGEALSVREAEGKSVPDLVQRLTEPSDVTDALIEPSASERPVAKVNRTYLRLSIEEVRDNPMMRSLLNFLCEIAPSIACKGRGPGHEIPKIHAISVTGRGSLWPLVRDRLRGAANDPAAKALHGSRILGDARKPDIESLKTAVVEGAIRYCSGPRHDWDGDVQRYQAHGFHDREGESLVVFQNKDTLRPMRYQDPWVVTYPIGLQSFKSERPGWLLSLLNNTGVRAQSHNIVESDGSIVQTLKIPSDGDVLLDNAGAARNPTQDPLNKVHAVDLERGVVVEYMRPPDTDPDLHDTGSSEGAS